MAENAPDNPGSVDLPAARIPVFADTSEWDAARERIKGEIRELAEEAKKALSLADQFDAMEKRAAELGDKLRAALDLGEQLAEIELALEDLAEKASRIKIETSSERDGSGDGGGSKGSDDLGSSTDQKLEDIKTITIDIRDAVNRMEGNQLTGLK